MEQDQTDRDQWQDEDKAIAKQLLNADGHKDEDLAVEICAHLQTKLVTLRQKNNLKI